MRIKPIVVVFGVLTTLALSSCRSEPECTCKYLDADGKKQKVSDPAFENAGIPKNKEERKRLKEYCEGTTDYAGNPSYRSYTTDDGDRVQLGACKYHRAW
jgi:hypothetical protein